MIRLRVLLLSMLAGCGLLAIGAPAARGEMIVMFSSVAADPAHSGQFTYNYNAVLTTLSELDRLGGNGNSTNGFTIYDVNGYVPGSASSSNAAFTASSANSGLLYPTQSPTDDADVPNVTFTYGGESEFPFAEGTLNDPQAGPLGAGPSLVGTFKFNSTVDKAEGLLYYSAATQRSVNVIGDEQIANNTGKLLGPFGGPIVPEPGSLGLLAAGAAGVLAAARRQRKSSGK
jgi:hypothetical protein